MPLTQAQLRQLEEDWPEDQIITVDPGDIAAVPMLAALKAQGYEFRWTLPRQVRALRQTGWEAVADNGPDRPILFMNMDQSMILVARKPTDPVQYRRIK